MSRIRMTSIIALALVPGLVCSSASGQQGDPRPETPQAPTGYLLIEEERWNMLADEPGHHIGRARDAYLMMDGRNAARELRKAAVHLRVAAGQAKDRTKHALVKSEHELEQLAQQIEAGTFRSIEEFDFATSRALHALASDQYARAAESWRKRELRQAGHYLRSSTDNLERAAARTDAGVRHATATVVKDTRFISGKLIDGTGLMIDEVKDGFETFGRAIERVGTRVEPTTQR